MAYRKLGNTDLQLSAITYGAFAIGGNMWGGITLDHPAAGYYHCAGRCPQCSAGGGKCGCNAYIFEEADGLASGFGTAVAYFDDSDGTHLEIIAPQGPFKRSGK